jgi:S1-C subfamily serine protease
MAGLRPGDVILGLDDGPNIGLVGFQQLIAVRHPNEVLAVRVFHESEFKSVRLRLGEVTTDGGALPVAQAHEHEPRLGLGLEELDTDRPAGSDSQGGLLVRTVRGASMLAGIERNDVIVGFDAREIHCIRDFDDAMEALRPGTEIVALLILRKGALGYVPIPIGEQA